MQAIEFESTIQGNTLKIPAYLAKQIAGHDHAKIIMLIEEKPPVKIASTTLKQRLLAIGQRCAALPILDSRSADDILGYDEHGLPS